MVEAVMAFPECPGGRDDYPVRHARRTWQAHGSLLSWALDELFKPGLQIKPVAAQLLSGTPPTDAASGSAAERAVKKARAAAKGVEAAGAPVVTPELINEANKNRRRRRMAAKQRGAAPVEDQAALNLIQDPRLITVSSPAP